MIRPTNVTPIGGYRICIEFEDGVKGDVDLSRLCGLGIFRAWDDEVFFNSARIDSPYRVVIWGDSGEVELCTDTFYMELTGKTVDEIMPEATEVSAVA